MLLEVQAITFASWCEKKYYQAKAVYMQYASEITVWQPVTWFMHDDYAHFLLIYKSYNRL